MRSYFRSLRFRLILIVMVALLPAVAGIVYDGLEHRRQATLEVQDNLRRLVALVAREQEQKTMAAQHLLKSMAHVPMVRQQEAQASSAFFAQVISRSSIFANISAADPRGNIFATAVPLLGPFNASNQRFFQRAMETRDFAVGDLQFGRIVLKPILVFAYPLLDMTGEVQTMIHAAVSMDWLQDLAAQARLPEGSVLVIVNSQRGIMMRFPDPEKWVGKTIPPGRILDFVLQHGQGTAEAVGEDGVARLYAYAPLGKDSHLGYVLAGIPLGVVYGAANQALARNLVAIGLVATLALLLAWTLAYLFVMRQVNVLVSTTRQVAAGDLSARVGLSRGPEELAQLAQDFDHMAVSLEEREAERRRAEEAFRSLVSHAPMGIFMIQDGKFILINPGFETVTGYCMEELLGQESKCLATPQY